MGPTGSMVTILFTLTSSAIMAADIGRSCYTARKTFCRRLETDWTNGKLFNILWENIL